VSFATLPRMRRWSLALVLVACVALQDLAAGPATFKPFRMNTPEGTPVALSDVLGKVTLVVFFFPTCGYCNTAAPTMQKLHETYRDRGLSMVWINVVQEQDALVAAWRTTHGFTVPVLLGGRSADRDYKVTATPMHYLIDAEGKILSRHAGYSAGDDRDLERRIREALHIP
jgi:thiol-disulfide isomerase/thioredoxin